MRSDGLNKFKLPCLERNGRMVTINDCEICRHNDHCDVYITILEESYNDENNPNVDS